MIPSPRVLDAGAINLCSPCRFCFRTSGERVASRLEDGSGGHVPRCTACAFLRGWWCLFGQTIVISSAYGSYPHSRMPRAGHAASTSAVCARRGKARTTDTPTHDPDTGQSRRLLYSYFQAGSGTDPPARLQRSSSEASSLAALHRTCSRTARYSAAVGESEG